LVSFGTQKKKEKYIAAIRREWETQASHTLQEVQELYGKLLHASLVLPEGHTYLISLETMLAIFHDYPFMPHAAPKLTSKDLCWWKASLRQPIVELCACLGLEPRLLTLSLHTPALILRTSLVHSLTRMKPVLYMVMDTYDSSYPAIDMVRDICNAIYLSHYIFVKVVLIL
jgi:hypothetical protein